MELRVVESVDIEYDDGDIEKHKPLTRVRAATAVA